MWLLSNKTFMCVSLLYVRDACFISTNIENNFLRDSQRAGGRRLGGFQNRPISFVLALLQFDWLGANDFKGFLYHEGVPRLLILYTASFVMSSRWKKHRTEEWLEKQIISWGCVTSLWAEVCNCQECFCPAWLKICLCINTHPSTFLCLFAIYNGDKSYVM